MRGDRLRSLRLAASLQIGGGGHHDPAHLADLPGDQTRIGEMPDPHREVDAVLDQIDHPVGQPQLTGHVGMA